LTRSEQGKKVRAPMGWLDRLRLAEGKEAPALDGPERAQLHARIIQSKPFLKRVYLDFYREMAGRVAREAGRRIVELGSGGGCIKEVMPEAVTSDIVAAPGVDRVFSATEMPFEDQSVDAFVMLDVLHHIPRPREFFREAVRCLKPDGKVVMIEPAHTVWSRFVYGNFHHEPFAPQAGWELDESALSNQALAWIIFHRDRAVFAREFPQLEVVDLRLHSPVRYILSGGLQFRSFVPACCYPAVKGIEFLLRPLNRWMALFETIELKKTRRP
jgi:SAM-dependent methyltransferase